MRKPVHIRLSTRIHESEDPELIALLLPLAHRERSRKVRALMRAGLGLTPALDMSVAGNQPSPAAAAAPGHATSTLPGHRSADSLDNVSGDFSAFEFGAAISS